jgi:MYXO-CTERM domain-containing protein
MRRALTVTLLSLALLPASLLAVDTAEACSCMPPKPAVESARDASVVFHAKLVSVADMPKSTPHGLANKVYTFQVLRTFKGQLDDKVNVQTADNSAACGRDYGAAGSEWLIYARVDENGQTHDNLCSRSRPIADAVDDIAELLDNADTLDQPNEPPPEPVEPADPEPVVTPPNEPEPAPVQPSKKGCSVGDEPPLGPIGLALALLGSLGMGLARRRR